MAKTPRAIAVARSVAETRLMMAALMGPVDKKRHNCAHTMPHQVHRMRIRGQSHPHEGAAITVETADSQR